MARAETDPTDDLPPKTGPSNWLLIVEDVFPRWRDRLGSSEDAKDELNDLLCNPLTRSARHKVDASGKEIPDTNRHVDHPGFWQDRLLLVPDADGGDDHLEVDYGDAYLDFYSPGGHWKFYVRRLDVERWERLYPELAAPPPPPPPAPPPSAPQTTAGAEARAIAHLKPLLELRGDAMSRREAWKECKPFNISCAGFFNHVWPTARELAGLERKAPAGRKKRKLDIESEVERAIGPAPDKK